MRGTGPAIEAEPAEFVLTAWIAARHVHALSLPGAHPWEARKSIVLRTQAAIRASRLLTSGLNVGLVGRDHRSSRRTNGT